MTQKGEQMTQKGEFNREVQSIFSFHKAIAISYSMDIENLNKVEIKLAYPNDAHTSLFQMIFVMKGKISIRKPSGSLNYYEIEGQQHNLCCLIPGASRMIMDNPNDEVICINLSRSFISRYLPGDHPAWQQLERGLKKKEPSVLSGANLHITPEISAILQRLDNSSHSGFCDQLLLEAKVIELLALQISQFEQFQSSTAPVLLKKDELERMHEAREILINHTGDQLSLRSLAHLVGTNEFNLKRNFKAAFGTTVYGYLNQHKMEQAKALLIEGESKVSEVSDRMGYKHATHFTSAFKKYFGYLPTKIKMLWLVFDPEFFLFLFSV